MLSEEVSAIVGLADNTVRIDKRDKIFNELGLIMSSVFD